MSITAGELALYAGALLILFLTPGPVWVALVARTLTGGVRQAAPLALGVVIGDVTWSVAAVLGISWVVQTFSGFMTGLRIVAALMFLGMGTLAIVKAGRIALDTDSRLTRPGMLAGFVAGLAVIFANPKAILFYAGVLPGFFDLTRLAGPDIAAIGAISALIPLTGNLALALFLGRVRRLLASPGAVRRANLTAGLLLICVGLAIPFL